MSERRSPPKLTRAPSQGSVSEAAVRIQKLLAQAGLGSRRQIEQWIGEGKVFVNGRVARLGERCNTDDRVVINGHLVNLRKRLQATTRVLLYHKPVGEVVSRRDPEGRPVVFTQLPKLAAGRWITVGRLDVATSGLLLVTTNGELANRLMHPKREFEREYAVRVFGQVDTRTLDRLMEGVELEDGPAHFDKMEAVGGENANQWFHVVVKEGRNRVVRRLWESQGVTVSRLIRIRFGEIRLPPRLKARTFMELPMEQLEELMRSADLTDVTIATRRDSRRRVPKRRGDGRPAGISSGRAKR